MGLFFNIFFIGYLYFFFSIFSVVFFLWIYKNSLYISDKISTIHLTSSQIFLSTSVCFKYAYFEVLVKDTYSVFFLYVNCSPFFSMVSLPMVSVTRVNNHSPEADGPPDTRWKVNSSFMLPHHAYAVPLTSTHHVGILAVPIIWGKGECSTVRYYKTETTFT